MSIDVRCVKCLKVLEEQGGLLFSPPVNNRVKKFHLCKNCYKEILLQVTNQVHPTFTLTDKEWIEFNRLLSEAPKSIEGLKKLFEKKGIFKDEN